MSLNIFDRESKTCKEVANKTRATILDTMMSNDSENSVQNKVIKKYVDDEIEEIKASIVDTKDSTVTFESNDTLAPTELQEMPSVLASKETHASLFSKISTVFRNMRYIIGLLGSTDISQETLGIGDSTVTGAIKGLNESLKLSFASVTISVLKAPISLCKIGRIVVFSYNDDTINSVNTGDLGVVGTIPEEFIPNSTYQFCNTHIDDVIIQLRFNDLGKIFGYNYGNSIDKIKICRYNGVYVTKN